MARGEQHSRDGHIRNVVWALAEEVPLQLLLEGEALAVLMVTPMDIPDFITGFVLTEQLGDPSGISDIRIEEKDDAILVNVVGLGKPAQMRSLPIRTSCGICGAQTLDDALPRLGRVAGLVPAPHIAQHALSSLPDHQPMNSVNRTMHAAGLAAADGQLVMVREDIGRHNALDKLIGAAHAAGLSAQSHFVVVSSRMSLEMVQKAALAGFASMASVSAPTALGIKLAQSCGMTVYAGAPDGIVRFTEQGE